MQWVRWTCGSGSAAVWNGDVASRVPANWYHSLGFFFFFFRVLARGDFLSREMPNIPYIVKRC